MNHIPFHHVPPSREDLLKTAMEQYNIMTTRRSIREFSDKPVDKSVISYLIQIASSAPSGAHKQPWTFCAVSDHTLKRDIRIAAEKEEYENYHSRMSENWKEDLRPLGTDWHKPFLEIAPWLIIIFKKPYDLVEEKKSPNYYVMESVGIAAGFLINAIHQVGLVTLTHTPSPMNFLNTILDRPSHEKPFLLCPVGYPAEHTSVPDLKRKSLEEVAVFYE